MLAWHAELGMPVEQLVEGRSRSRRGDAAYDRGPGGGDRLVVPVGRTLSGRDGADAAAAALDRLIERLLSAHREEREAQVLAMAEALDPARLDEPQELTVM
jgi:hypothetical protein